MQSAPPWLASESAGVSLEAVMEPEPASQVGYSAGPESASATSQPQVQQPLINNPGFG